MQPEPTAVTTFINSRLAENLMGWAESFSPLFLRFPGGSSGSDLTVGAVN